MNMLWKASFNFCLTSPLHHNITFKYKKKTLQFFTAQLLNVKFTTLPSPVLPQSGTVTRMWK